MTDWAAWTDTDGDGLGNVGLSDTNGNGIVDTVFYDLSGDGIIDGYGLDANESGYFETLYFDTSQNGFVDGYSVDSDENHVYDAFGSDPEEDGVFTSDSQTDSGPGISSNFSAPTIHSVAMDTVINGINANTLQQIAATQARTFLLI
ncbi:hypothetical protein ACX80N_16720 [Arthrobacter sp. MDT2-16]